MKFSPPHHRACAVQDEVEPEYITIYAIFCEAQQRRFTGDLRPPCTRETSQASSSLRLKKKERKKERYKLIICSYTTWACVFQSAPARKGSWGQWG